MVKMEFAKPQGAASRQLSTAQVIGYTKVKGHLHKYGWKPRLVAFTTDRLPRINATVVER